MDKKDLSKCDNCGKKREPYDKITKNGETTCYYTCHCCKCFWRITKVDQID